MSPKKEQEKPNYRFQYQQTMLSDGRVYNSIPVNFDFFAKNDSKAIEVTRRKISDLEKACKVSEDGNGSEFSPNYLKTLKGDGESLRTGRDLRY